MKVTVKLGSDVIIQPSSFLVHSGTETNEFFFFLPVHLSKKQTCRCYLVARKQTMPFEDPGNNNYSNENQKSDQWRHIIFRSFSVWVPTNNRRPIVFHRFCNYYYYYYSQKGRKKEEIFTHVHENGFSDDSFLNPIQMLSVTSSSFK
mgnify:CR=1 FL=1